MWWNVFVETTILRRAVLLADLPGEVGREVLGDHLDALLARQLGDVGRAGRPERSVAAVAQERKEQPVVAADVDRQRIGRVEEAGREALGQPGEVAVHRLRRRGDVDVVAEVAGRHLIVDLDQAAIEADANVEREASLRLAELLLAQEAVGERMVAEREEEVETVALARPADRHRRDSSGRWRWPAAARRRASHHSAAARIRSSSSASGSPAEHAPRAARLGDERGKILIGGLAGTEANPLRDRRRRLRRRARTRGRSLPGPSRRGRARRRPARCRGARARRPPRCRRRR